MDKTNKQISGLKTGEIIQKANKYFSEPEKHFIIKELLSIGCTKATALRQSILKKAFDGKLLSTEEIAKCKADKDYEPASVLLERIKAEKKMK